MSKICKPSELEKAIIILLDMQNYFRKCVCRKNTDMKFKKNYIDRLDKLSYGKRN